VNVTYDVPKLTGYRNFPLSLFPTASGKLVASQSGSIVVDDETGAQELLPASLRTTQPFVQIYGMPNAASDSDTGAIFASTDQGVYRVDADLGVTTRIGDGIGSVIAYDARTHTLYGIDGVNGQKNVAMDTTTGAVRALPPSTDLTHVCPILQASVSGDGKYIDMYTSMTAPFPPPPDNQFCNCVRFDLSTVRLTNLSVSGCPRTAVSDGRFVRFMNDGIDVVDPIAGTSMPFSQSPGHGRGFPFPNDPSQTWAIASEPRRDRWWLGLLPLGNAGGPGAIGTHDYFFVIDPYNGDRVLVSY
jgi:hypothetical protein